MDAASTARPTGPDLADTIVSAHIEPGPTEGTAVVVFEGPAVPGTLATFTGILTLHGLDISSVTIVRSGERVRDTFHLHVHPGGMPGQAEVAEMASQASAAIGGAYDLAAEMDRRRVVPGSPDDAADVRVSGPDAGLTHFVVSATDRPGLLYDLAATLSRHSMRTRSISVVTAGGTAVDTFGVVGPDGRPPTDPDAVERVRTALLSAARGYLPAVRE